MNAIPRDKASVWNRVRRVLYAKSHKKSHVQTGPRLFQEQEEKDSFDDRRGSGYQPRLDGVSKRKAPLYTGLAGGKPSSLILNAVAAFHPEGGGVGGWQWQPEGRPRPLLSSGYF